MSRAVVEIEVELVARTERAVLVHTGDEDAAVWLPLTQVDLRPTGAKGVYTMTLPERVAIDKGLV